MSKLPIAALLSLTSVSAFALCLNPFGCEPKNYDECIAEATRRPTEGGVKVARQHCLEKWQKQVDLRKQADRNEASESRATEWKKWTSLATLSGTLEAKIGQPDLVYGPHACSSRKDAKPPKGITCYTYLWNDTRPGRYQTYFKAEVMNDQEKAIWSLWKDSISM